jgi:hypothetical protein
MKQVLFNTIFTILFSTLLGASNANAGWVSSGGGELFGDAHNPWFVRNVTQVNYCIDLSMASFSADITTVRSTVTEAIQYWKNEFAKAAHGPGIGQFELGTQSFTEVNCSDPSVLLRFQFGYETLSPQQIAFLGNPLNYIGVAIRTDYNEVGTLPLQGKGFIFVASDKGSNAYHGGKDSTLTSQAWKNPRLLKYVLLHELGHVFGMPHTGSGIMSEAFLEQMLSTTLADAFINTPIPSFFLVDDNFVTCQDHFSGNNGALFFDAPSGDACLRFSRIGDYQWSVESLKDKKTTTATSLGRIIANDLQLGDFQSQPTVVLQLMGDTQVFTPKEASFRSFMFGPRFVNYGSGGNFVPLHGNSKSLYAKFGSDSLVILGTLGTKIQPVVNYVSPIGILLMQNPMPYQGRGE